MCVGVCVFACRCCLARYAPVKINVLSFGNGLRSPIIEQNMTHAAHTVFSVLAHSLKRGEDAVLNRSFFSQRCRVGTGVDAAADTDGGELREASRE